MASGATSPTTYDCVIGMNMAYEQIIHKVRLKGESGFYITLKRYQSELEDDDYR